jgi:hypothetical protein
MRFSGLELQHPVATAPGTVNEGYSCLIGIENWNYQKQQGAL